MKTFFIDNNSEELILFFLGWGMDERPMLPLKSNKNILYIYDYSNLDFNFDYSEYKKVYLISFSAGVSISAYLNLPNIDYSVAINGTYDLCHSEYGLDENIIKVFENITMSNYIDFRKNYLLKTAKELEQFNQNSPIRTLQSSMEELNALKTYNFSSINYSFDKILISKDDQIIPIEKQKRFWGNKITTIQGGHFAFYNYQTIEELIC